MIREYALPIVFGISIVVLVMYIFIYVLFQYFGCACSCVYFGHSRNRYSYEEITDIERNVLFNSSQKSFGQDTCRICLDEMEITEDLFRAPCRHKFHKKCLERWSEEHNRCPMCNHKIELTPIAE